MTFADSLQALKLDAGLFPKGFRLERTRSTFEAELPSPSRLGSRWIIGHDSWIRRTDPPVKK